MADEQDNPLAHLELVVDNPSENLPPIEPPPDDAPPAAGDAEGGDSPPKLADGELPGDCVVTPLGLAGELYYYLDQQSQLCEIKARDHGRNRIVALFGARIDQLKKYWPKFDSKGTATTFRPERVTDALMASCARLGPLDVSGVVRGPGAWLGMDGELIYHCGDAILRNDGGPAQAPGRIDKYIYPAAPPMPKPSEYPAAGGTEGAGNQLLMLLQSWRWRRDELDSWLMLGWIGAAVVGGALGHRPLVWITGDRATGKSTLHDLIRAVFENGIVSVSDVSAAGIWQRLKHSSAPVAIDELEAEEDNRRTQNVLRLARQAATGGVLLRGDANHSAQEFTTRSSFMFSSILVPPLLPQDRSRMAILELLPLDRDNIKPPDLTPSKMAAIGAQLRRRMADQWPRFARTLDQYRVELAEVGHGGRGADQFGTLLACADLLVYDAETTPDVAAGWAEKLPAVEVMADQDADNLRCLEHILTSSVDQFQGGGRAVVSELVAKAAGIGLDSQEAVFNADAEANKVLQRYGLRVLLAATPPGRGTAANYLAVANSHQGLAKLFDGTHWAAKSGASSVWNQSLGRFPGAINHPGLRFSGRQARCTLIPLDDAVRGSD